VCAPLPRCDTWLAMVTNNCHRQNISGYFTFKQLQLTYISKIFCTTASNQVLKFLSKVEKHEQRKITFVFLWVLHNAQYLALNVIHFMKMPVSQIAYEGCYNMVCMLHVACKCHLCGLRKSPRRIFMVAPCMLITLNPLFVQLMQTQIILKLLNY
jgi:hypothetical protein